MKDNLEKFKAQVRMLCADPKFIHHPWFVEWHLEIVSRISAELAEHYPEADKDMVELLAWFHDYGKPFSWANDKEATISEGLPALRTMGFDEEIVQKIAAWMELFDNAQEYDLHDAPIEVQIVSSADGCSHTTGPFMQIFWKEFADRPYEQLMDGNRNKAQRDWDRKIVLPEARQAFGWRLQAVLEQNGALPDKFLDEISFQK
jgi:hypothetical protein